MSPAEVRRTLGLEKLMDKMVRYEDANDQQYVCVYVMRDGYGFTVTYDAAPATRPLALRQWVWRSDVDWPEGVSQLKQSLASLDNPFRGTQQLPLTGVTLFIQASRFEEVKKREPEIRKCARDHMPSPGKLETASSIELGEMELGVRNALNDLMPGRPIRWVSFWPTMQ
jgi:hypothetical protein